MFGDAGVGKTRLVTEVVEQCKADGVAVEWIRATEAASRIPLGSFAHLLARDDEPRQRDDLLHYALARLHSRVGERRLLLAVDDAHLLDEVSVALLHLLVTQTSTQVLISVRTGETLPPGLVGLWKDELLARIDVGPLSREATEQLVMAVLGDTVPASLLDRMWALSRGNALFVRELVTAAVERRETGVGGRVVLSAGPRERLRELVEERLRLLEPPRRAALELVAVGEEVPLEAVERLAAAVDIEALETRGLIEVVDTDRGEMVQVAHPLYGEVLATGLPLMRRRAVLRDLVAAVEDLDHFDRLRLATWRLASGAGADDDAEQLLQLARQALGRFDHRLAERLALAAGGAGRVDAGLVFGEALSGQARHEEAASVLARLRPDGPEQVARLAVARASELFLHLDRSGEAFEVLQQAVDDLAEHPDWQADCRSVLAQMCTFSMRLAEAGQIAEELLARPDLPDAARVRAVSVAAWAWGAQGRVEDGLGLLTDDLYAVADELRQEVPYGDFQLRMMRYLLLFWSGRAHDLDAFTASNLGLAADGDRGEPPPSLQGILAGFRGGALLARGRVQEALVELQRSSRALAENDWFGQRSLAEAMRCRAAVFAGNLALAEEAIAVADAAYAADPLRSARTLPFIELSRALLEAAQGAVAKAAQGCIGLATAMEHLAKPMAVEALHAAVRLGRADAVVDAAERLGGQVDGPFAGLLPRHARALVAGDPDELMAVADGFEALGADLLAAEVLRSAANAYRREGKGASALAASRQCEQLLQRCGCRVSPGLEAVVPAGEELTDREREVALLAAGGRSSQDIAAMLYLSVRTVDTHLHRVYRKLMIEGRHELADALGTLGRPPT